AGDIMRTVLAIKVPGFVVGDVVITSAVRTLRLIVAPKVDRIAGAQRPEPLTHPVPPVPSDRRCKWHSASLRASAYSCSPPRMAVAMDSARRHSVRWTIPG